MTTKEFWKQLAKTKNWQVTTFGCIRKKTAANRLVCPICAVANKKLKKNKFDTNAGDAGRYLGLNSSFIGEIIEASDNDRYINDKTEKTRKKLLNTLEPKTT